MIRLVVDTNVLVSALWSKNGNPYKIIQMIPDGEFILYLCDEKFIMNPKDFLLKHGYL